MYRFALLLALPLPAQQAEVTVVASPPVAGTPHYQGHRAPLAPEPLLRLPAGRVRASGWLQQDLQRMAKGMFGRLPEVSRFCRDADNAWLSPKGAGKLGWEELPYWLKGLVSLGVQTQDPEVLAASRKWLDAILASQREDGWFGPESNREQMDLWPNMPVCKALMTHWEATQDARVLPFLLAYARWQLTVPRARFLHGSWQKWRGGDNLLVAHWLHDQTGESWLLELAAQTHAATADWTTTIPTWHGVNLCQGFREPAQWSVQSKDASHLARSEAIYQEVYRRYGQVPGGMFGADENCRPGYGDPRQAAEACSMVEMMYSQQLLLGITGDIRHADRCEDVAFNSLPAATLPDMRGLHYLTAPNLVSCDAGDKAPGLQNGGCMLAYSAGERYRCCQHNVVMGWPFFAEHTWWATRDQGLAFALYAPSEVTAKAGAGSVRIVAATEYPYADTIQLEVHPQQCGTFPLYLRVPGWCEGAQLEIGAWKPAVQPRPGQWLRIVRAWRAGDRLLWRLPMRVRVQRWPANQHAATIARGPLTYALPIAQTQRRSGGSDEFPEIELLPASAWNYALVLGGEIGFAAGRLQVEAKPVPGWVQRGGLVGRLQPSPVRSDAPATTLQLVPMGQARLRIAMFPVVGEGPEARPFAPEPEPPRASHVHDDPEALRDGVWPAHSDDHAIPRFTWWDKKGTQEWVQYDFPAAREVSECSVYWFDDAPRGGGCRVPLSWRLLWQDGTQWRPVATRDEYATGKDRRHTVRFQAVRTTALRLEVQLQPGWSGGVFEWELR